jgi:hypothetical protein
VSSFKKCGISNGLNDTEDQFIMRCLALPLCVKKCYVTCRLNFSFCMERLGQQCLPLPNFEFVSLHVCIHEHF